ncbi:MAG: hypothetical protein P4L98_01100 [Ancalomicrobiaceae bacterium]|nr:hypothetical protein [Ancalomicrobiaceae bacterium]
MSAPEAERPAKQHDQSMPGYEECEQLDRQYKTIGISAVSAAAQMISHKKKPTDQMS